VESVSSVMVVRVLLSTKSLLVSLLTASELVLWQLVAVSDLLRSMACHFSWT